LFFRQEQTPSKKENVLANTAEEITKQLKEIKNSVSIFEKFLPTLVQYF
jgi:hypothetical protein